MLRIFKYYKSKIFKIYTAFKNYARTSVKFINLPLQSHAARNER